MNGPRSPLFLIRGKVGFTKAGIQGRGVLEKFLNQLNVFLILSCLDIFGHIFPLKKLIKGEGGPFTPGTNCSRAFQTMLLIKLIQNVSKYPPL